LELAAAIRARDAQTRLAIEDMSIFKLGKTLATSADTGAEKALNKRLLKKQESEHWWRRSSMQQHPCPTPDG